MPQLVDRAQARIKEIKTLAKNDRVQAERLVRAAIDREPQFLRDLVEPFLAGIIAHVLSGGSMASSNMQAVPRLGSVKTIPHSIPAAGMDGLLKTMSVNLAASAATPGKVSPGHADTIRALAEAQKARKKREG